MGPIPQPTVDRVIGDLGRKGRPTMLWTIFLILIALWLLGLIGSIGGAAIHLLLIIAGIVFIAQLISGRSTAS